MTAEHDPNPRDAERQVLQQTPTTRPEMRDELAPEPKVEPKVEPSLGYPWLDAMAQAVGGPKVLLGIGGAALLAAAVASVGLFPPKGTGSNGPGVPPPAITAGQSMFTPVGPAGVDNAINLLMLPEAEKAKVRAEVERGNMRLALVIVLDNDAEDGDWVSISGAGLRQDVRLFHKPYTVAVPYLPGMPVTITGLKDGGGGDITVTVMVGAAKLSLKPLKEREVIEVMPP
jgi:hypothetical protein